MPQINSKIHDGFTVDYPFPWFVGHIVEDMHRVVQLATSSSITLCLHVMSDLLKLD